MPTQSYAQVQPLHARVTYVGSDVCEACHEDIYQAFLKSPHYQVDTEKHRRWKGQACEACHGPGEANTGNVFDRATLQFFAGQTSRVFSQALQPHTSAILTAEVRPVGWLRILESWTTDRLHTAGSATTTQQFTTTGGATTSPIVTMDKGPIATNYSREEINLLVDPIPSLTLRGGYRYEWGDVLAPLAFIGQTTPLSGPFETAGSLAGVSYRWKQKLTTSADVGGGPGNHNYFRTSLYNYSYARVRARYQALPTSN